MAKRRESPRPTGRVAIVGEASGEHPAAGVMDGSAAESQERVSHVGPRRTGTNPTTGKRARPKEVGRMDEPDALLAPSPDRVLFTVLGLSRAISMEMDEEEIVHAHVASLRDLFPRRLFAVRLFDPDTGRLLLAHATGRLRSERRQVFHLTRAAIDRHGLDVDPLDEESRIVVVEQYAALFGDQAEGFDVPLLDGTRVIGVLSVEYPPSVEVPSHDPPFIVPLALQLGAAIRNARLVRESVYLRDYLSKLLDHANALVLVIDKHREISVVNRALCQLTGFAREDLLGHDFAQLLPESMRRLLLPVFINALRGEPTSNVELSLPRRGGGQARVALDVASILSADGEVEGVIAIGRDLTEVRKLEEQVIHAEKLATLGQLAAGVVHEINNPLTSISVYGEYLLKKTDRHGGERGDVEKLRRIVESADRILNFTRDLVVYARPSAETPTHVSIADVIDQSVVFCEHVLRAAGASVEKSIAPGLPSVLAVKGQLHQVFINLITNACHAMEKDKGRLSVRADAIDGGKVCVRVEDNGAGIGPEHVDRIFEPFFSTKGEGKGTGLGLSIVRNIVSQHGGEVTVTSTPGKGTCFQVTLLGKSAPLPVE